MLGSSPFLGMNRGDKTSARLLIRRKDASTEALPLTQVQVIPVAISVAM
jgi:hypothetical protein